MPKVAREPLKLLAEDADDLAVMAAALQDAVAKIGDVVFEPNARRLTIAFNRYRWESGEDERVRSALQIGSVLGVKSRRLRRGAKDAVVELLTVSFEPAEAPGGVLVLTFAGGGDLRATIECVDAILMDISQPWPAKRSPGHEI
jgi:hypothetical protein